MAVGRECCCLGGRGGEKGGGLAAVDGISLALSVRVDDDVRSVSLAHSCVCISPCSRFRSVASRRPSHNGKVVADPATLLCLREADCSRQVLGLRETAER